MEIALEEKLKVKDRIDTLEDYFDCLCKDEMNPSMPARTLRRIKIFLYENWSTYKKILRGSILDSRDCTVMTSLANMLANRKGLKTKIASPTSLNRFLHTMLVYATQEGERIFEITSKQKNGDYRCLGFEEIYNRLLYVRYLLPFLFILRPNNHTRYLK